MENQEYPDHTLPSEYSQPSIAHQSIASPSEVRLFKDPARLTGILKTLLFLSIILSGIAVWSGYLERVFLNKVNSGYYDSEKAAVADAERSDFRQGVVGLSQVGISIASLVFFWIWVHRANSNVRSLGATGLQFTPGWSVGWYFIPIANLWKPYQAMKEIFKASKSPRHWFSQNVGTVVQLWWIFWIISGACAQISLRSSLNAESIDELLISNRITLLSDIIDIPSAILSLLLVSSVFQMQMSHIAAPEQQASQSTTDMLTVRNDLNDR